METKEIPDEVIEKMKETKKRYNYTNEQLANDDLMKKMLRNNSCEAYYKNVSKIRWLITGIKPVQLTPAQEKQMLQDYQDLQVPFQIFAAGERKNMCFFRYEFKKLCEKNGYYEFLRGHAKFMKSTDNLAKNDRLFKKCFLYLGWPWKKSI